MSISDLIVRDGDSLRATLTVLDRPGPALAIAVDGNGRYLGVADAASIENAIAAGHDLDARMTPAIRPNGALPATTEPGALAKNLEAGPGFIPLLDAEQRPVDYASPSRARRIPVAEPSLSGNELKYVTECLTTGWISSQGPFVRRFEADIGQRLGVPAEQVLAVSNGTVALHLALVSLGIGSGDEVIVPDLTFAATINTVLQAGATPVVVDVDRVSLNIDPAAVASAITARTKAIMPVHLYGQPAEMDALLALAARHKLLVIEDAAEAMGSAYKGKPCGAIGDAGTFSFFSNKLITTGEGGAIVFRDPRAAQRARMLRDHGMDPKKRYWHLEVGFNYRLTNMQAALGCAQLEQLDRFLARKIEIAQQYGKALGTVDGVALPASLSGLLNSYWAYSIVIDFNGLGISRDDLAVRLDRAGIETRPLFYPLHEMPPYKPYVGNRAYPVTTALSGGGLSLPSAVTLTVAETGYISGVIARQIQARRLARRVGIA